MNKSIIDRLLDSNVNLGKVGSIIHVGAGRCAELDSYLNMQPADITLIEANPTLCKELQKKTECFAHVKVLNQVVSAEAGESEFYFTQPEQFSGLNPPLAFQKIFKNLKVIEQKRVLTQTLVKLVEAVDVEGSKQNILVLQLNDTNLSVLSSLPTVELQKFNAVVFQATKDAMHVMPSNTSSFQREGSDSLNLACFKMAYSISDGPVFETQLFIKDKALLELKVLKKENADLAKLTESLKEQVASFDTKAAQHEAEFRQQLSKSQDALSRLREDKKNFESLNEQLVEKLTIFETRNSELEQDTEVLQDINQRLTSALADLEGEKRKCESLEQQKSQLESKLSISIGQYNGAEVEIKELLSNNSSLSLSVESLQSENSILIERNNDLNAKLLDIRRQLSIKDESCQEHQRTAESLTVKMTELSNEIEVQRQLKSEMETAFGEVEKQLEAEIKANQQISQENKDVNKQLAEVTEQRDYEHKWHVEHKKWSESLVNEKEELSSELQASYKQIYKLENELVGLSDQLSSLKEERSSLVHEVEERKELLKRFSVQVDLMERLIGGGNGS